MNTPAHPTRPCIQITSALAAVSLATGALGQAEPIALEQSEGKVVVTAAGGQFAEFLFGEGRAKPVIYPVLGPGGVRMTRDHPFKETAGEANDHPHHESLWFTHGDVNGVSFWHLGDDAGTIVADSVKTSGDSITAENRWVTPGGDVVCTDTTTVTFGADADKRTIDFTVTVHATAGDITFGDTKEGTMGIRTHPDLRLKNDQGRGVTTANGHAVNSAGDRDTDLWGKSAAWVDYWGDIDGKTVGIAIFDHPDNLRHPTTWHARDYGLIAANPFGLSDFQNMPKGTGDFVIKSGDSATWRYRFVFHTGDATTANVGWLYEAWVNQ